MATVEDIYQKIRRGETKGLDLARPSDEELDAGVARIRGRLAGTANLPQAENRTLLWKPQIWLPAIAAMLLVGFLLWPKTKPADLHELVAQGTVRKFGTVELTVLNQSQLSENYSENRLTITLTHGMLLIRRHDPVTALRVLTPEGDLSAMGTVFVVEHNSVTSVHLIEGRLNWKVAGREQLLDPSHNRLGRDLKPEITKYLSEPPLNPPVKPPGRTLFRKGDCVYYTLNGNRREGIIREVVHGEFRVTHEGIEEPDLLTGSALIGCGNGGKP